MEQFKALSYKNFVLWRRGFIGSFLQIVLPIALFCLIFIIRINVPQNENKEQQFLGNTNYTPIISSLAPAQALGVYFKKCTANQIVALVPKGDSMVDSLQAKLSSLSYNIQKYETDQEVDSLINNKADEFCFGITFQDDGENYKYAIRGDVNSGFIDPRDKITVDDAFDRKTYASVVTSGMVGIATVVNGLILQKQFSVNPFTLTNTMGPIYQQKYTEDEMYTAIGGSIGIIILFPLILVFSRHVGSMVMEKQKKIKANMIIMGMKLRYYNLTWFLRYFFVYFFIHLIISGLTVVALPSIPYYIPLVVLFFFDILLVIQGFFTQIFFERGVYGIIFACLVFAIFSSLSLVLSEPETSSIQFFQGISVIPHIAVGLAFREMLYTDSKQLTIDFSSTINYYSINTCIISLVCNIVFWLFLTWYLQKIIPNNWGIRKHPCFCFGCSNNNKIQQEETNEIQLQKQEEMKNKTEAMEINPNLSDKNLKHDKQSDDMESQGEQLKEMEKQNKVIKIRNLVKYFDDFQAVKGLNLTIPTDELFVLLGHNGAGKTTTISMLAGVQEPTDGAIEMFGASDFDELREIIGVCPQENPLYDDLTVKEHLQLFGAFKGIQGQQLEEEVTKLIGDVDLEDKTNYLSQNLSGGQKRKLSVAIAFTGGSKVIILDEPTAGMDTYARRFIWEMLKNYRQGRVILLTTHLMDEADYLGDRIGIMMDGQLVTCGSSVYLKNKFGLGYNLTIVKEKNDMSSRDIVLAVAKFIPDAYVMSDLGAQLKIELPLEKINHFSTMFDYLDEKKSKLGIKQYGISITTLEQVFLSLSEGDEKPYAKPISKYDEFSPMKSIQELRLSQLTKSIIQFGNRMERETNCCKIFLIQTWATLKKRFRINVRDRKSLLFEFIFPLAFIILGLLFMTIEIKGTIIPQVLNYDLYLSQKNPVRLPMATQSNTTYLQSIQTALNNRYGQSVQTNPLFYQTTAQLFDQFDLYPLKQSDETLKGGVFFHENSNHLLDHSVLTMTTVINTRSPTSFITIQTAAAEAYMNAKLSTNKTITVINDPFPEVDTTSTQVTAGEVNSIVKNTFGVCIFSVALAFKFSSIAFLITKQKQTGSKDQQLICGMRIASYWVGNFIYDYLTYCIIASIAIGFCFAFDIQDFIGTEEAIAAVCLLFFLYGLSNLFFTYTSCYIFKEALHAQVGIFFLNLVMGGILTIILIILRTINNNQTNGFTWFLRIFPAFSFGEGVINLGGKSVLSMFSKNQTPLKVFDTNITLAPIIYLAATFVLFIIILIVVEVIISCENKISGMMEGELQNLRMSRRESDVVEEQEKVKKADISDFQILTKNLTKVYNEGKEDEKVAVNNVSFSVDRGEIFGLLGTNGAGKSTTFKMLSGEILPTMGEIYFMGLNIKEDLEQIRQNLGYCPQTNPIINFLSVKEQLELFYDMKCLPSAMKERVVRQQIQELNLEEYEDKLSGTLSGGNKRKLSVGIAIIGNPGIIFLDEPSAGMDPKSKRFMWKVISRITSERKQSTVILTTHSMDEAEALSTRLAIMVNGSFKCLGTPQHIKSKYGKGYEIQVKLDKISTEELEEYQKDLELKVAEINLEQTEEIIKKLNLTKEVREELCAEGSAGFFWEILEEGGTIRLRTLLDFCLMQTRIQSVFRAINKQFGSTQIIEHFQSYIRFKVITRATIGNIFKFMQSKKEPMNIQQYSINQATIEQIFNTFANTLRRSTAILQ